MRAPFLLHSPDNELEHIDQLWAFISLDEQGREGIMGAMVDERWFMLATGNPRVLEQMKPLAKQVAAMAGKSYKLLRFARVEECKLD